MRVLVLSSEKKGKASRKRRRLIIKSLEKLKTELLNPMPGRPPQQKSESFVLFPDLFFGKNKDLLNTTDLVIADLTKVDSEIEFIISSALEKNLPVLGLYWQERPGKLNSIWFKNSNFFIEVFRRENIRSVLRYFLEFINKKRRQWGKLIVLDGSDGSGKKTQLDLLVKYLKDKKYIVKTVDFPQYYSSFYGQMVGDYLSGKFGKLNEVNPYLVSLAYSSDRLLAKKEIEDWLEGGCYVIANRYISSNMAFQTVKLPESERDVFLNWLIEMEYKVNRLPKEDLGIFLHVPVEIGQKLVDNKKKRKYLSNGKSRDLHEQNLEYLKKVENMYRYIVKKFDNWVKVDCLDKKGKLLSKQKIHEKIVKILERYNILN